MKRPPKILVADDHEEMVELLADELRDAGYDVDMASSGKEAVAHFDARSPDLVITDLRMRGIDGFDVLEHVQQSTQDVPVVIMTAFGEIETAIEAIKRGAFHYVSKPFKIDEILVIAERALESRRIRAENRSLRRAGSDRASIDRLIGDAESVVRLRQTIERLASVDATVLIRGESGTGKELVARALHVSGSRASGAFVPVNCTTLPRELLESELFGHLPGSFTGATDRRMGLFVEADNGTLFLDEIGDMPLDLQAKLLRVLEEGAIRPVGSDVVRRIDVRVVAATHQPLEKLVRDGTFRQDLLYRLDVLPIHVPALVERAADIPLLVEHFLGELRVRHPDGEHRRFDEAVLRRLTARTWPGNVRELENAVQRLFLLADQEVVDADTYARVFEHQQHHAFEEIFEELVPLRELEDRYIRFVLQRCQDNKTKAAEVLGIDPSTLHRRLRD